MSLRDDAGADDPQQQHENHHHGKGVEHQREHDAEALLLGSVVRVQFVDRFFATLDTEKRPEERGASGDFKANHHAHKDNDGADDHRYVIAQSNQGEQGNREERQVHVDNVGGIHRLVEVSEPFAGPVEEFGGPTEDE